MKAIEKILCPVDFSNNLHALLGEELNGDPLTAAVELIVIARAPTAEIIGKISEHVVVVIETISAAWGLLWVELIIIIRLEAARLLRIVNPPIPIIIEGVATLGERDLSDRQPIASARARSAV